jgi:hypothetical protein
MPGLVRLTSVSPSREEPTARRRTPRLTAWKGSSRPPKTTAEELTRQVKS